MHVRKTFEHRGVTLAHGSFRVRETEHICAAGCTEPTSDGHDRRALVRRQPQLAQILLPRSTIGYDVMAFVGIERFVRHHQREEIREALKNRWCVEVSAGEVSALAMKFCAYLKALHLAHARQLRTVLASDGGWPMHVDATGEDGQGTLLVIYAGWRRWVLGAWKIPTERADAVLPRMTEMAGRFGPPCAVMRDLGRAVIEASRAYVASLDKSIPDLACHMHFVRDVGKDLLQDSHDALRALFRRFGIVAHMRAFVRDLGRTLGADLTEARRQAAAWIENDDGPYRLPTGNGGLGIVRALAQWTLDYQADGRDEGFPFDRPWYDFYGRCTKLGRVAEAFLSRPHTKGATPRSIAVPVGQGLQGQAVDRQNSSVYRALKRLFYIVATVRSQVPFGRQATILSSRAHLLDELRAALRLDLKPKGRNTPLPVVLSPEQADTHMRDIEAAVTKLTRSLRDRRPDRGPAQDMRQAVDLVLDHLCRHGPSLFGHLIALPEGGVRAVERTNVLLESFFHVLKRGERRRSGRKNLAHDFEHLPPEAALALNLTCADYLDVVCCGSLDNLPAAFAGLDAGHRDRALPARTRAATDPLAGETVSSSMTTIDRRLVRTAAMANRVRAAARSRAVRLV